ncbi:MAG: multicopper oxidase domain-containing protein [Gemmatimonadota bacterium]|nr:multicopper oxidase domain-containing protein [Gemmatimonadota bacterium]
MKRPAVTLFSLVITVCGALPVGSQPPAARALANDNRTPAGILRAGALTLHLELREARWYPEGDDHRGEVVQAFAEEGKPATIPGPLVRVNEGTRIRATIRNTLARDTLVLYGFGTRPGSARDTLRLAPRAVREIAFGVGAPGTYYYWGSTTGKPIGARDGVDSQLSGALIVDPRGSGPPRDRVFVLGAWHENGDTLGPKPWVDRDMMAINGRSWPRTERFTLMQGDRVRWRWINPTADSHPMHLHGFYYDVNSRGGWAADTMYASGDRRRVVTELMLPGATMTMGWRAERPGNWLFHCHFAFHVSQFLSFDTIPTPDDPGAPDAVDHSAHGMRGLVLGLTVRPRDTLRGAQARAASNVPTRAIRLLVTALPADSARADSTRERYSYVIHDGSGVPRRRGPADAALVLVRGQPVRITVVNRLRAPTAVHWHGIELEQSYSDGVPGWSGAGGHLAPAIAPGDSFAAEFTPRRAGTFILHSHANEGHQISSGLYDALIVRAPVVPAKPPNEIVVLFGGDNNHGRINHRSDVAPLEMTAGRTYRLRLININPDRRIVFSIVSDSGLLAWRAVAKDGADLSARQATTRPATLLTGAGEAADFELTATAAQGLRLEATTHIAPMWRVSVPIHVRPALPRLVLQATVAITHVTVIDVATGARLRDRTVVVRGNRITSVEPSARARVPREARAVDGRGKYLIPGLWDMHVHALRAGRATWMFPLFLAAGVTGIRDTGSPLDTLLLYRAGVGSGEILGPRIVGAGPLLDAPPAQWGSFTIVIESPTAGRHAVDSLADAGVNFIKVYNGLSRESFLAIADEAKRRGVPVIGHVPESVTAIEASEAGMRSMEHLVQVPPACVPDSVNRALFREFAGRSKRPGMTPDSIQALRRDLIGNAATAFSEALCEQLGARFARNGTWQVPTHERLLRWSRAFLASDTAATDTLLRYVPSRVREMWRRYQDSIVALGPLSDVTAVVYPLSSRVIRALHRGGDGILAGTDTDGNDANIYGVPGFSLHRELEALVRDVGLTPLEAVRAATLGPARLLGATDSLGTIARGKVADLVLLDADPLADIHNANKVRAVIANGRLLDRATLDTLLAEATRRAKP